MSRNIWLFAILCPFVYIFSLNRTKFQEGEDENDMDGNEPAEHSTLINDEESEHTMLLGRGINQQQYKGNHFHLEPLSLRSGNGLLNQCFCFSFFAFMM